MNFPSQKPLTADDYDLIKKCVKSLWVSNKKLPKFIFEDICLVNPNLSDTKLLSNNFHFICQQANRSSIPFQNPVNPEEVPNYYKVIKEPMGK